MVRKVSINVGPGFKVTWLLRVLNPLKRNAVNHRYSSWSLLDIT